MVKLKQGNLLRLYFNLLYIFHGLIFFLFFGSNIVPTVMALESNQYLGDQLKDEESHQYLDKIKNEKDQNGPSAFLPENLNLSDAEVEEMQKNWDEAVKSGKAPLNNYSSDAPEIDSKLSAPEKIQSILGHVPEQGADPKEYQEADLTSRLEHMKGMGNKGIGFYLYKDSYQYESNKKPAFFNKIYRDSPEADPALMFLISGKRYLSHTLGGWGVGLNFAVGYNGGKGYFSDGSLSEATFRLWTVPLDLWAFYEFPLITDKCKITLAGGPSALVMIQNRSDLDNEDKRKSMEQWSWGYFADLQAHFALGRIFPSIGHEMFRNYSATNFLLTISARMHEYSHFKSEDIAISGVSVGGGVTLEYF